MKKRNWIILVIIFICLDIVIFYTIYPSSPAGNISSTLEQEKNETQTPEKTPKITLPWSSEGSPEESGGESGGSEGISGGGSEGTKNKTKVKVNYTLNIDSSPPNLKVITNYSVNNVILNIENETPYSVEIEQDTFACIILSQISGSGIISYEVDGKTCEPSLCLGFIGCSIFMNAPHSAMVYYKPTNVTG